MIYKRIGVWTAGGVLFNIDIFSFTCLCFNGSNLVKKFNFEIHDFSRIKDFSCFGKRSIIFNKFCSIFSLNIDKSIGETGFSSISSFTDSIFYIQNIINIGKYLKYFYLNLLIS